jgi:hypothetical protein
MDPLKPRTIGLIGRLHAWLWKRRSWVKALVSWALKRWEFRQVLALRLVRLGALELLSCWPALYPVTRGLHWSSG